MKYINSDKSSVVVFVPKYVNYSALFLMLLAFLILHSPSVIANNDKVEVKKILQNTFFNKCYYSGEVVLEVEYKLMSEEVGNILLEGTLDSVNYFQILTKEIDKGKGRSNLVFDAGECLQAIRISFE